MILVDASVAYNSSLYLRSELMQEADPHLARLDVGKGRSAYTLRTNAEYLGVEVYVRNTTDYFDSDVIAVFEEDGVGNLRLLGSVELVGYETTFGIPLRDVDSYSRQDLGFEERP